MTRCLVGTVRLQKLPARYKMYEHQRHQLSDLYIYGNLSIFVSKWKTINVTNIWTGHPSKQRFRSATQFRRHLLWLESNSAKAKCDCSLCALLPTEKQEGKVEAKPHRVLSPAVRAAVTSRRSRTHISSPKAVHVSQERSCLPDVAPEVLTPHKLGLSNPRPLKSRNKSKNG
jgi:hypothetical protein